jgi:DNA-binding transcriptional ArsR family regulator
LRAVAFPPFRPAAFFCAVVPPCEEEERDDPECEFFPPRLDAPGEFAIRAARSFDIPLSFSASYCFSFFTFDLLLGITHPPSFSPPLFMCSRIRSLHLTCRGSSGCVILNLMVQYSTKVDRAFAALADPTRRAVVERLGSGSATISELAQPFGMSLTGMKKHIRLLEEAELVTTEKVGRVRRCMLAPYAFEGISTWLQRLDRFADVVEHTKGER